MTTSKRERTVLCLGPPHSGKSVFSYLLFKFLRELRNKACLMDGDYYSPTHRRRIKDYASPEEVVYIITTPNIAKLSKLTHKVFRNLAHSIHASIEFKGIIVLDGIGKHSESTESLLELASILVVLCPNQFSTENSAKECGYAKNDKKMHPFDFYSKECEKYSINRSEKCIKIITHFHDRERTSFDQDRLEGEVYGLDWSVIKSGNIDKIPHETRNTVLEIARLILKMCYGTR